MEGLNPQILNDLVRVKMPFGKYKGSSLISLPEEYLLWFAKKGWPEGTLGGLLQLTLEIKINGLEKVIYPLQKKPTPLSD
jgi:uncharacterized protein (DUF3820 family)